MNARGIALGLLMVWPATVWADRIDHLPVPSAAMPTAAAADTSARVYAALISGRDERRRDLGKLSMNITNYGFIGNNFNVRTPSMEYPVGSGHEHLVRGGLWIGARGFDANGEFLGVTTGAADGFTGDAASSATEFSPEGERIDVRSTLRNDRTFSPLSVSERDLIGHFDDLLPKRAQNNREDHRPLGVVVRQDNYQWSFTEMQHILFFHFVIKNTGAALLDAYVGLYNELASGPKNSFSNWPPGGAWFSKKQIAWVDSLNMFTERYCQSVPVPGNCFYSITPEIAGVKLLGVRPGTVSDPGRKVTMQAWDFAPGDGARDEDIERYALMSSGEKTALDPLPPDLSPRDGDPVELIAVGPFPRFESGDSIEVDFAYIGGTSDAELVTRAKFAQAAYDLNYIVPIPPPSPRLKAVPHENSIDLYWERSPEDFVDPTSSAPDRKDFEGYRLYVGTQRDTLQLSGQFDLATAPHDTTGFNTGLSAVRLPAPVVLDDGETYDYKFTLTGIKDGFKQFVAVTSYDLGDNRIEPLESGITQNELMVISGPRVGERAGGVTVFPNPYRVGAAWDSPTAGVRERFVWFANLPARAKIRIYTLAGDLVYEYAFDGATYTGDNARGIYNPASDLPGTFSGASFGWDLVTQRGQAAATGLYLWVVEDETSKQTQRGKLLIVKSDREGLR